MSKSKYQEQQLGELIHIKHGYLFKSEYFSNLGKYILLTPGNFFEVGGFRERPGKDRFYIGEFPSNYILKKGDLIVAMTEQGEGLLGSTALIPSENQYLHNQRLGLIRIKDSSKLDKRYLFYLFNISLVRQQIRGSSSGTKVRHTSPERIYKVQVEIPPLFIQEKISAIACAYDDLIENNDRRITLLEKMAEEIYREWFVRLRFPGHEQVASHKGIPEDWESKRFDEFCLLQRGFDLPDDKVKPGIYPVVASTSIKTYHSEPKVNPPVITTGRSGSLGTVLFVNSSAWPLNTTLFVKNFFGNSPYLIYYTLKFLKLENFNAGAGVPSLNRNHLGGLHMSVPPKILQNRFDENISIIFKQKENLANANEKLKQTRDRLLTRLISGKLSVEDLDIQLPPSMTEAVDTERQ
jgi:type I restriction enzyme, S subunit